MTFISFNSDFIALLPEIFFILSINVLIVYGVIYTTSPFFDYPVLISNISWIAIQIIAIMIYLIVNSPFNNAFIFSNLLIVDTFGAFIKTCLALGTIAILIMCLKYSRLEYINSFEFLILILLTLLGSLLIVSSNDLISMYLAIELQSFCSYVITSFKRDSEFSAEAGLKYFVLGALSSGFLLFGCSIIYGSTGTTNFEQLSLLFLGVGSENYYMIGANVGVIFIATSLLFKLSAAPFHLWSPDIYEGAPTVVTAFFAIVPKIGLLSLFVRLFFDCLYNTFIPWQEIIIFSSICSMCIGSFGAIWQIKIKRLLAFSAIGHVGYILMGICASSTESIYSLFFYSIIYIIMSICTFLLILLIRKNHDLKKVKYIEDLTVLSKTNPLIGLSFAITFFSIAGVPPLAGFFSKMFIFLNAIANSLYILAFVGVLTSVVSCFYYLRIIQISYFEQTTQWITLKKINKEVSLLLSICLLLLVTFFFHPSLMIVLIHNSIFNICI